MKKQAKNLIGRLALTGALAAGALGVTGCAEKPLKPRANPENMAPFTLYDGYCSSERTIVDQDGDGIVDFIGEADGTGPKMVYWIAKGVEVKHPRFQILSLAKEMPVEMRALATEYLHKQDALNDMLRGYSEKTSEESSN